MKSKLAFKHVLIISPRVVCCQGLEDVLSKHLQEAKFTFLTQLIDGLPDKKFDWSDIDLMLIDLSKHKRAIYDWYSKGNDSDSLPPAIFLGHPVSFKDAGFFYRVGAADYLDLRGLKTRQLLESLVIVSAYIESKHLTLVRHKQHDGPKGDDKPLPLKFMNTGEIDMKLDMDIKNKSYQETRAEFINTGIMDILQRDKLRKIVGDIDSD